MPQPREVVITGLGVVCPLGVGYEAYWSALAAGKSGIECLDGINDLDNNPRVGGTVKNFDATAIFGAREARRLDKASQFGMNAAEQALIDSATRSASSTAL